MHRFLSTIVAALGVGTALGVGDPRAGSATRKISPLRSTGAANAAIGSAGAGPHPLGIDNAPYDLTGTVSPVHDPAIAYDPASNMVRCWRCSLARARECFHGP